MEETATLSVGAEAKAEVADRPESPAPPPPARGTWWKPQKVLATRAFFITKAFSLVDYSRDDLYWLLVSPRGRLDIGTGDEEGRSDFAVFLQDYESLFALIFFC